MREDKMKRIAVFAPERIIGVASGQQNPPKSALYAGFGGIFLRFGVILVTIDG